MTDKRRLGIGTVAFLCGVGVMVAASRLPTLFGSRRSADELRWRLTKIEQRLDEIHEQLKKMPS